MLPKKALRTFENQGYKGKNSLLLSHGSLWNDREQSLTRKKLLCIVLKLLEMGAGKSPGIGEDRLTLGGKDITNFEKDLGIKIISF